MSISTLDPTSHLFAIRDTEKRGRGIFASQKITQGTMLLATGPPFASVIFEDYGKEVCAWCFGYDRGRSWGLRRLYGGMGVVFCDIQCQETWVSEISGVRAEAWEGLQGFVRRRKRKSSDDGDRGKQVVGESEVEKCWAEAECEAQRIRECRKNTEPTKRQRLILQSAQNSFMASLEDPYIIRYMFSGLFPSPSHPEMQQVLDNLTADPHPYKNPTTLNQAISAYLLLLATAPASLLPSIAQSSIRALHARSSHNAFSLRSLDEGGEDGDAGSECFGYGLWPIASYWNHSCAPNVQKRRVGRTWSFWAARDVQVGEELCISYLGGDERVMGVDERREKLRAVWGFECECEKCGEEVERGKGVMSGGEGGFGGDITSRSALIVCK